MVSVKRARYTPALCDTGEGRDAPGADQCLAALTLSATWSPGGWTEVDTTTRWTDTGLSSHKQWIPGEMAGGLEWTLLVLCLLLVFIDAAVLTQEASAASLQVTRNGKGWGPAGRCERDSEGSRRVGWSNGMKFSEDKCKGLQLGKNNG